MSLGTFIAGRFSGTYAGPGGTPIAADIGLMEKGYRISVTWKSENIDQSDGYADMVIEQVFRGGNVFINMTAKEYKQGILNAVAPYSAFLATGATYLGPGIIARLSSNLAGSIVLSSTAGTPAAAAPATLTANFAIISEDQDIEWLYGPEHRKTPMKFRILPFIDADTFVKWLKFTALALAVGLQVASLG